LLLLPPEWKRGGAVIYMYYANSGQHMAAALTDNYDSHLSLIIMRLCIQFVSPARQIVKQVMAISICRGLWLRARRLCPSKDSRKIIAWNRYIILMMFFLPFLYFFYPFPKNIFIQRISN